MTDPSYKGQILVFTTPLIGNYGVPSIYARDDYNLLRYFESAHIQCAGIIVADVATRYSHWTAVESLGSWCAREGVAAVSGVDTRAIVTYLRERGSSLAKIRTGEEYDADDDEAFFDPGNINLVRQVCTEKPFHVTSGASSVKVAVIDCGVKENILRSLVATGCRCNCLSLQLPYSQSSARVRWDFHDEWTRGSNALS